MPLVDQWVRFYQSFTVLTAHHAHVVFYRLDFSIRYLNTREKEARNGYSSETYEDGDGRSHHPEPKLGSSGNLFYEFYNLKNLLGYRKIHRYSAMVR